MKKTLTRLFTVALLLMVSLGARAEVKVLFGVNGTELQPDKDGKVTLGQKELTGGTVIISQEDQKNGTTKLFLAVTPDKGYTLAENGLEVYTVAPADISQTRTVKASTKLDIKSEDFKDEASKRTYTTTIDSKLALWVKGANFQPQKRDGAKAGDSDFSGTYFISGNNQGVNSYDITKTTENYYLCPTVDWLYFKADATNYFTDVDNGQPFITTYQYRNGVNDESEAVWRFEKHATKNLYYIIHNKSGKYLVSNQSIKTASSGNRLRVHLEAAIPADEELALFAITNPSYFNISPKKHGNYMNVTQGNQNSLKGTNARTDGPTGEPNAPTGTLAYNNIGGTIGLWTNAADQTSKWYLELFTPEISVDNCVFTLSYPIVDNTVEIRYTTDGTVPTTSSNLYESPFEPGLEVTQIKAAAFKKNISTIQSPTVTYEFPKLFAPTYELNQAESKFILNTSAANGIIYYKTGGANPTIGDENDEYRTPFNVTQGTVVKAIVAKNCYAPSQMMTHEVVKVETPIIAIDGNKVTINCSTYGAVIHYTTDGNAPTAESPVYTLPLSDMSGKTIKAIAMCTGDLDSDVASSDGPIVFSCQNPVIRREVNNKFSISCSYPADGVTIHYTIDGSDPTEESLAYTEQVEITTFPVTVKARAFAENYNPSAIVEKIIGDDMDLEDGYYIIGSEGDFNLFVQKVNNGNTEINAKVTDNFSLGSQISITQAFCGIFDGGFFTISGLRQPLFSSTSGAVIKNVMLKDVQISGSGAKGAIAGIANGYTRIYNCGILPSSNKFVSETSVISSSDGYCGGLVGELNDDSRVVNCFSYAKIMGGTVKAGIVGYNQTASTTAVTNGKYENLKTMVVNCMFYGDITGSTGSVYPVYGGSKILNTGNNGINNYNYYRAEASITPTDYNCSWPASEENLTRFEYYRYLLNSNRELCGWWVGSNVAPNTLTTAEVQAIKKDASLIGKWVLDPSIAPYPILKPAGKYPSVINPDPARRIDPDTKVWVNRTASANTIETNAAPDTEGQTLGSVTVTVVAGSHHSADNITLSIPITAMDLDNLDFCYGKIQLPYYNEVFGNPTGSTWSAKYGDNYSNMVVTGWDIDTSDGTAGTFSDDPITGNVFADRNSTAKDTHRVFAQGGYYYVPYGVGNITITAHWATAYYLDNGDDYYDRTSFSSSNAGKAFAPAGTRTFESGTFGDQTIFKGSIQGVLSSVTKASTVYDCAIVLVGNHQYKNLKANVSATGNKPFTIMSVDLDFDNEPDYCLEWQIGEGTDRAMIDPVKFDFLPIVELGVAMKEDASTNLFAMGKLTPYGHFEVTETSIIHFGQFEYENVNRTIAAPVILNNGTYDQFSRGTQGDNDQNITYFLVGGHIKMPVFSPGAQVNSNATYWSRHCAVNVLGGEFAKFYLTGNFNNGVTPNKDNPHCYIDGGKLDMVASAAKEGIDGDVYWKIDHAYIGEFYGGGINADKRVTGSIDISIDRSKVTKFCGGPMFGDMYDGKTVTTRATGTTFGVYYGAGNGGTSYSQYDRDDNTNSFSMGKYTTYKYQEKINGVEGMNGYHANYELEMVNSSAGTNSNVNYRTYVYAAQFATTNTGNVSSTLTDCRVETNFFGGGNLGGVNGSVTSLLTGHTVVEGSVYGAGYSAKDLSVEILPKEGYTDPSRDANTAVVTPAKYPDKISYIWTNETTIGSTTLSTSSPHIENVDGKNYLYTEVSLTNLGAVSEDVHLTLQDDCVVNGSVYGGGDESAVNNTTTPANAYTIVTLKGNAEVFGNVFGGGNNGLVSGSTTVNIEQ